jgi:hypothetical protein
MKRFRLAVIIGTIATVCLVASFAFYQYSGTQAEYNKRKYFTLMRERSESSSYRDKLRAFDVRWKSLAEFSREKGANVSYDVSLQPAGFDELNDKILSTYQHGFFFLKGAVLEGSPEGVRLAVSGFKKGDSQP